ncbi:MAG: diaminopimelate epimerase [Faecousia sp.]
MQVYYMNGAGNDFMVVDARGMQLDYEQLAIALCKLTGADGFMAVDNSDKADFRLHFYNADGSRGEMCGNGARCICRFAYDLGIAGAEMTVETDAGLVPGWRLDQNQYRVKLNNPSVLDLHRKGDVAYVELGNPGVPHAVKEYFGDLWADADALREELRALRFDKAFPKGANVNFYQVIGEAEIRILTFERGVEDYTLACGTGCGSTASTLWKQGRLPGGVLTAYNRGGTLKVTVGGENGQVNSILLEGPTQIVEIYDIS